MTNNKTMNFIIILCCVVIPTIVPLFYIHPALGIIGIMIGLWFCGSYFSEPEETEAANSSGTLSSAPATIITPAPEAKNQDQFGLSRDDQSNLSISSPTKSIQMAPGATMDNTISLVPLNKK